MVATAETTPIERIPLQKDEGGGSKTAESPNEHTAAPPLPERAHGSPTASQPTRQTPPLRSLHGSHPTAA